jgi:ribosomal protein S18 acetylase RimI-like enzyme
MHKMNIRSLEKRDIKSVAILHNKAFENFFLTSLGTNFLKIFYNSIIKSKNGIALGAFNENNELIGFAVGTKMKKGFYKEILKNNFILLLFSASKNLIIRPKNIFRLFNSFLAKETSNESFLYFSSLLSICVDPDKKGANIGKDLLRSFEVEAFKWNDAISLTTDALNNDYVNKFYVLNGYILTDNFRQSARIMNFYIKRQKNK